MSSNRYDYISFKPINQFRGMFPILAFMLTRVLIKAWCSARVQLGGFGLADTCWHIFSMNRKNTGCELLKT